MSSKEGRLGEICGAPGAALKARADIYNAIRLLLGVIIVIILLIKASYFNGGKLSASQLIVWSGYAANATRLGEKMKKDSIRLIALYGVMLAVLLVAMTIDRLLSSLEVLSFAVASVATTATFSLTRRKFLDALGAGFFFGLSSLITALWFGKTAFFNPLVSVLPRTFIGITAFAAYLGLSKLFGLFVRNERVREYIALSVAGGLVAVSNTVYTLTCLWLFAQGDPTFIAFNAVFITNALPEMIVAIVATPPIVLGVRRGLRLNPDGTERVKKEESAENIAKVAAEEV